MALYQMIQGSENLRFRNLKIQDCNKWNAVKDLNEGVSGRGVSPYGGPWLFVRVCPTVACTRYDAIERVGKHPETETRVSLW